MSTLFFILAFIALIGLVAGLIKPEKVKMKSRKKALSWFGGSFLVFIILMGITAPPVDPAVLQAREAAKIEKQKQRDEAAAAKKAEEANAKQASYQEEPEAQKQEVNTVTQPEKTPEQLLEDTYRSIVKNTGSTDFSYKGIDITKLDEKSKMIVIEVNTGDFWNKNSLIRDTGELASNLFQASLNNNLQITDFVVWYYGEVKDIYGNTSSDVMLSYASNQDTIQKINWDGFDKTKMCDFLRTAPSENFNNVCTVKAYIE